jgi:hypothetical protein
MLAPPAHVTLVWKSLVAVDPLIRTRVAEEVRGLAWTLSQMEALLHDAHRATALEHAFLMPRIELKLPLYDLGRRYRIVLTYMEKARIALMDEDGRKLADVRLL